MIYDPENKLYEFKLCCLYLFNSLLFPILWALALH